MKRKVKVEVTVVVHYETPLDLRKALTELRREGPIDVAQAGHTKRDESYAFALRTLRGAKVTTLPERSDGTGR